MALSYPPVNPFQRSIRIGLRDNILHPNNRLNDIVNVGEVALHLAVVVDINTFLPAWLS
jgi:hypothetical protein